MQNLIEQGHEVHTISQRGHVVSEKARGHYFTTVAEYETLTQELLQNKTAEVVVIPNDLLFIESKLLDQFWMRPLIKDRRWFYQRIALVAAKIQKVESNNVPRRIFAVQEPQVVHWTRWRRLCLRYDFRTAVIILPILILLLLRYKKSLQLNGGEWIRWR